MDRTPVPACNDDLLFGLSLNVVEKVEEYGIDELMIVMNRKAVFFKSFAVRESFLLIGLERMHGTPLAPEKFFGDFRK